jgi:UDP-GlcNAc:undecaprenyl-phosphate GlcNAc-1-phosphate transferase
MRTLVAITFALTAVICWALTELVRRAAGHYGVSDRDERRGAIAYRRIPRVGGIAIALTFTLVILVLLALEAGGVVYGVVDATLHDPLTWLFGTSAFAIGLVDDFRALRAELKLLALLAIGAAMSARGHGITQLPLVHHALSPLQSLAATAVWYAAIGTAWNFIDGLDGLAAGLSIVAAVAFGIIGWPSDPATPFVLAGVAVGFLAHNRHPSVIFMGDGGSFFFGFWIATLGLTTSHHGQSADLFAVVLCAIAWPLADMVWAFVRRAMRHTLFEASADHLHYILHRQVGHRRAVQTILSIAGVLAVVAVALRADLIATGVLFLCVAAMWIFAARVSVARPAAMVAMYLSLWMARGPVG